MVNRMISASSVRYSSEGAEGQGPCGVQLDHRIEWGQVLVDLLLLHQLDRLVGMGEDEAVHHGHDG